MYKWNFIACTLVSGLVHPTSCCEIDSYYCTWGLPLGLTTYFMEAQYFIPHSIPLCEYLENLFFLLVMDVGAVSAIRIVLLQILLCMLL